MPVAGCLRAPKGRRQSCCLHRYGGDRSWLFNLGVKINETTNFTILWPDLRGHGETPPVRSTTLGIREGDDLLAALHYLRGLKSENQRTLVGETFGVYGVELGAYSALKAARMENNLFKVLVLDSVMRSTNDLLNTAVANCVGLENSMVQYFSRIAMRFYLMGLDNTDACGVAKAIPYQRVLLLSGPDAGDLRETTNSLKSCFPDPTKVETRTDLPLSGYSLPATTGEQGEAYDRVVIEYFDRNLR